jgi:sigma-B regulation protein RsbU (phosphoserine phosphatase)
MNLQKTLYNESFIKSANSTLETVKFGMEEILTLESYETINKIFLQAKKGKYVDFIVLTLNRDEIFAKYPDSLKISINRLTQLSLKKSLRDSVFVLSSYYKSKLWSGELFIGFSTKEIREHEQKVLSDVGITNLIILSVIVIGIILITTNITKPLENLRQVTEKIRKGNLSTRADETKGGLEVTSVSRAFNQMISDLTHTQKELQSELSEASIFVFSILPEPIKSDITVEWRFIPSRELGGDAFGYHYIDDENLAIYLIDVAGHGVGAALLSVSVVNIMRTQSLTGTNFHNPSEVFFSLNQVFQMDNHGDKFFTVWYGVLNKKTLELKYSCAGHPPAFLVRKLLNNMKEIQKIGTRNNFIGFLPNIKYESKSFQMQKGDSLYIYSDGLSELLDENNKLISEDEFIQSISEFDDRSIDELLINLRDKQKNHTFTDDCSIIKIIA